MPKFRVYGIMTASKFLGEFEAETEAEALEMGENSGECYAPICHQYAGEISLGDIYEFQAEPVRELPLPPSKDAD